MAISQQYVKLHAFVDCSESHLCTFVVKSICVPGLIANLFTKVTPFHRKFFNKGKWQFTQFTRYFRVTFWPYTYFKLFAISLARYLLRRANLHISICSTVAFRGFRIEWLPRMASWPPFFYTSYCFGRTIIPHLTTFLRAFSGTVGSTFSQLARILIGHIGQSKQTMAYGSALNLNLRIINNIKSNERDV